MKTDLYRLLLCNLWLVFTVILVQLAVKRFAADAEGAGGVRFIAGGVVERRFDRLALYFFHRRRNRDLESGRAALARCLGPFDFDPVAVLQSDLADRLGQVFNLNGASGSYDHRTLDCVFELPHVAGPVVSNQRLERVFRNSGNEPPRLLFVMLEEVN